MVTLEKLLTSLKWDLIVGFSKLIFLAVPLHYPLSPRILNMMGRLSIREFFVITLEETVRLGAFDSPLTICRAISLGQ